MTSNNLPKHKDKVFPKRKNSDKNFHNHNFNTKTSLEPTPEQEEWLKKEMRGVEIVQNRKKKTRERKSEVIAYKYSNKGKGELRESVFIEGLPYFIKYSSNKETGKNYILCEPKIQEATRVIRPPQPEEYPYEAYEFKDVNEPDFFLQRARNETIDSLYQKIKTIVKKFNDRDQETLILLSAYILCSYFQDKFSTVAYLDVTGDNGTGKSALGDTFESLAYRAVNMTDPTPANWYRVLGAIEFGQVTIVADEADRIEESSQVMSILKTGYQIKGRVPRMDTDNKKQEWYYAYCMKVILHEKSFDATNGKGILDRCLPIDSVKGFPQNDIKEVRNPQGNPIRQRLLDEIVDLRKTTPYLQINPFQ